MAGSGGEKDFKFLVVDSSSNSRKIVRQMLKSFGYKKVAEAEDGDRAMESLKLSRADFVISDFYLPKTSGLELLRQVRDDPSLRGLPFLIITSEINASHITQAAEEDVDGYIIKPFRGETLEKKINCVLDKKENPPEVEVHISMGNAYKDNKMFDKALLEYEKAVAIKPRSARINHSIGQCHELKGDSATAEEFYKKAVSQNPRYLKAHHSMGEFYIKNGDEISAIRSLQLATAISPNNTEKQFTLGRLFVKNGNPEEAEKAFSAVIKNDPQNSTIRREIGEIYLENGFDDLAAKAFRASLEINRNVDVYNRLGIALRRKGRYVEAIEEYNKALSVNPMDEILHYNVGKALIEAGQKAEAAKAFRKALEINPDFEESKQMLREMGHL